jgi:uncharacterized protein involved in cysteine biosynthesis
MLKAVLRALAQLSDPALRRVVWIGLAGALLGSLAITAGVTAGLESLGPTGIGWADHLIDALGGMAALLISLLLFPAVAGAISSLLLDEVVAAVEQRHYPWLPAPRIPPLAENLRAAARFFLVVGVLNLATLPLHLIPGAGLMASALVNGYLLGREYFELVACRRLPLGESRALRHRRSGALFTAGLIIWGMMSVPLLNLAAPVLAAAFMVHVFHRLSAPA